jgi:hypothetical protein
LSLFSNDSVVAKPKGNLGPFANDAEMKIAYMHRFAAGVQAYSFY